MGLWIEIEKAVRKSIMAIRQPLRWGCGLKCLPACHCHVVHGVSLCDGAVDWNWWRYWRTWIRPRVSLCDWAVNWYRIWSNCDISLSGQPLPWYYTRKYSYPWGTNYTVHNQAKPWLITTALSQCKTYLQIAVIKFPLDTIIIVCIGYLQWECRERRSVLSI